MSAANRRAKQAVGPRDIEQPPGPRPDGHPAGDRARLESGYLEHCSLVPFPFFRICHFLVKVYGPPTSDQLFQMPNHFPLNIVPMEITDHLEAGALDHCPAAKPRKTVEV